MSFYGGSLIHVTRTSDHSISNHPRFSTNRVPLPLRWQLYFVRASSLARGLARTADRIEFTLTALHGSRCYGLVVRFPLLSTRGYRPVAVTFSYWPYSVGQVGDSHPAVPVRSQAHEHRSVTRSSARRPGINRVFPRAIPFAHAAGGRPALRLSSGVCQDALSAARGRNSCLHLRAA